MTSPPTMPRRPVAVQGACGRMGRAVIEALDRDRDFHLAYRGDPSLALEAGPPRCAPDLKALGAGEVAGIIDFSVPEGAQAAAEAAVRVGCALVSGTTALDGAPFEALQRASRRVPVCWAPNFSVGIPLLSRVLREAAGRLPRNWELEIVEIHHAKKKDAPSGTALRLLGIWQEERGGRPVPGRSGVVGPRDPDEIGIHAVRLAGVVGEHQILLGGAGETVRITHGVEDRAAFATGAVEALRRIGRQGPGWYEWEEILFRFESGR